MSIIMSSFVLGGLRTLMQVDVHSFVSAALGSELYFLADLKQGSNNIQPLANYNGARLSFKANSVTTDRLRI